MTFSATDIIALINECKRAGVGSFEWGDLKFNFTNLSLEDPVAERKAIEEEEFRLKSQDLELMRLEDPLQYEKMISQREFDGN